MLKWILGDNPIGKKYILPKATCLTFFCLNIIESKEYNGLMAKSCAANAGSLQAKGISKLSASTTASTRAAVGKPKGSEITNFNQFSNQMSLFRSYAHKAQTRVCEISHLGNSSPRKLFRAAVKSPIFFKTFS